MTRSHSKKNRIAFLECDAGMEQMEFIYQNLYVAPALMLWLVAFSTISAV